MLRLAIFLSTLQLLRAASGGGCRADFDVYRAGECRGGAPNGGGGCSLGSREYECADSCTRFSLFPLIIRNDEDQSYWTGRAYSGGYSMWLPIYCNSASKIWEWYDGSPVDYKPPVYDQALERSCFRNDGLSSGGWLMRTDGSWITLTGTSSTILYFCTGNVPRLPIRDDGFAQNPTDGQLYQIISSGKSWQDARESCQKVGAELVSVHNQQTNSFVRQLAISNGAANGLFLGANALDGNLTWSDGSDWDFANAASNSFSDDEGDCIAMNTFSYAGQWFNADCAAQLPYACVKSDPMITGPWQAGQNITSPGYPYDASIPADYLLTVPTGFVEVTIEELQANSCCDLLILSDEEKGGKLVAKLTGQILPDYKKIFTSKSNFMKVSWQPNGAKNVKGFRLTYRSVTKQPITPASTKKAEITTLTTSRSDNIVYTSSAQQTTLQSATTTTVLATSTSPARTTSREPTTTSGSFAVESALMTTVAALIIASLQ